MIVLHFQKMPCSSCAGTHDLYLALGGEEQSDIRSGRYLCPATGQVVGARLKGIASRHGKPQPHWIECLPACLFRQQEAKQDAASLPMS